MSFINLDCDHPFVKKVQEASSKDDRKYRLESDEEREMAKVLVERGFLYYSKDYDHVAVRDLRKFQ